MLLAILCCVPLSYASSNIYQDAIEKIEETNEQLSEELDEMERELLRNKNKDIQYYNLLTTKTQQEIDIIQNEIDVLQYITICQDEWILCYSKIELNEELTTDVLQDKIIEYRENIELEEEKIKLYSKTVTELAEEDKLLEERQKEEALEYIKKGNDRLGSWDIKWAISSYNTSCKKQESFECYYGLGLSQFELAKKYYENIDNYGYDRLFNEAIREATESLEKAVEITNNTTQVQQATELLEELINYPNKEEKETIQELTKDTTNKQVELIWSRIVELTSSQSETEKQATYTLLITKKILNLKKKK